MSILEEPSREIIFSIHVLRQLIIMCLEKYWGKKLKKILSWIQKRSTFPRYSTLLLMLHVWIKRVKLYDVLCDGDKVKFVISFTDFSETEGEATENMLTMIFGS